MFVIIFSENPQNNKSQIPKKSTSSPRPYVSPEENETSRFLQERHMAVGTRLPKNI